MKEPISEWNMYDKVKIGDLMPAFELIQGDCLQQLTTLPAASVDAVVCDPPYGLRFLQHHWDHGVPGVAFWSAALRVAKPGAHLLAFGGTRTFHRLAVAIEDAGWEIRDTVMWLYGSGFPKSHNVGKGIDKAAGAQREVIGYRSPDGSGVAGAARPDSTGSHIWTGCLTSEKGVTDAAKEWDGWGTALKPAWEPIIVARKPLDGTVASNVLAHGTGAINIDGCRVGTETIKTCAKDHKASPQSGLGKTGFAGCEESTHQGRWPANLIHDGSEEVLAGFPQTTSANGRIKRAGGFARGLENRTDRPAVIPDGEGYGDTGSAARFFYCAKASKADRDEGCEGMEAKQYSHDGRETPIENAYQRNDSKSRNHHPTVKPTKLMKFLCRLITPPAGTVLDPFMGSGSTGKAAVLEGFNFIGIEKDAEYIAIARARIASAISREHAANAETSV